MEKVERKSKKQFKMVNSIALLFMIIVFAAILTYLIPAGQFERTKQLGKMIVDPASFHYIKSSPATFFDIFRAVPYGMAASAMLVVSTLIIGGALEVVQSTKAINIAVSKSIKKIGIKNGDIILVFMFCVFSAMGAFLGFIEGSIPFIPLAISIAVGLGYDTITGAAIALVGAISGFAAGPTNPFTVGIAQSLTDLPMFSGAGLRIVLMGAVTLVSLYHILKYARKSRKNPELSYMKDIDTSDLKFDVAQFENEKFTLKHGLIIIALIGSMGLFLYGSLKWKWYFNELSALFLFTAIFSGIISKISINDIANTFIKGASGIAGGAMIIGIARGIEWILTKSNVMDTIIYNISIPLHNMPMFLAAIGMLIFISIINFIIPSGSAKALILMPIILPISSIVGISQQTAILIYQLGDGITNLCTPVLGVVLLALAFGKVPFDRWFRFITPLVIKMMIIGVVFIFIALKINY